MAGAGGRLPAVLHEVTDLISSTRLLPYCRRPPHYVAFYDDLFWQVRSRRIKTDFISPGFFRLV